MEVLTNLFTDSFWYTASFIAVITVALTSTINAKLNPNKVWKQVISWVISVALTVGAYFLDIVNVSEPTWLSLVCIGLVVGLTSNGLYDIPFIKSVMNKWMDFLGKGKE